MHQQKVKSKANLKNISKSDKGAYFRRVFVNNFFLCIFTKTLKLNCNQREILRFWYLFDFYKYFYSRKVSMV
jgi:hypothetical protein